MAVGLLPPGDLFEIDGIRLSALHSGIKADASRKDLTLIEINPDARVAAVFTRNKFCAAPVTIAKQHLQQNSQPRYLLINSGNANAGTGTEGLRNAETSCNAIAVAAEVTPAQVLPFSTGVIAQPLPIQCIEQSADKLIEGLAPGHWLHAAEGIMTTDTLPKAISVRVEIDGQMVSITGIAKGSGMIKPDMATMLAFVATDAEISASEIQPLLQQVIDSSFNSITVDGDTSTNDACVFIATGKSGVSITHSSAQFLHALRTLFQQLAQAIIRDAEGATKFVEIQVDNASSFSDAKEVAYTVAHSPLVKTALFASDPNWGRILAAVGRAKIEYLDIDCVDLYLGNTCLLKNGLPDDDYTEAQGQSEMDKEEICIRVNLNQGDEKAVVWTSDLSYDYVKINAEYRS